MSHIGSRRPGSENRRAIHARKQLFFLLGPRPRAFLICMISFRQKKGSSFGTTAAASRGVFYEWVESIIPT